MIYKWIILLLVLFLIIVGLIKSCNTKDTIETVESLSKDSTWYWKDRFDKEHARSENLIVEKIFLQNELKHTANTLKIKEKQIRSLKSISSETKIEVVVQKDSFYKDSFIFVEKRGDTLYFQIKDTLKIVDYWKRTWFLGKKKYYVDISASNPYTKINSITAREIKIKHPKIIIGPSVQYNPFNNQLTPGISVLYYPFTIKL